MRQRGHDEPLLRMTALFLCNLWRKSGKEYQSGRDDRKCKGFIRVAVPRDREEESR
jgi:hypothetical protein